MCVCVGGVDSLYPAVRFVGQRLKLTVFSCILNPDWLLGALIFTEKPRKDPRRPEKTRKDPKRPEKTRKDTLINTEKTRKDALIYTEKTRKDPRRPEKTRKDPKRHPKRPKKTRKDIFIVDVSEWKMTRVMLMVFEH